MQVDLTFSMLADLTKLTSVYIDRCNIADYDQIHFEGQAKHMSDLYYSKLFTANYIAMEEDNESDGGG